MASNSERIRQLMDLLEQQAQPQYLTEGWLQNLKNKRVQKLGAKQRAEMAGRLRDEWLNWLGQTGRDGTLDDMLRFMKVRIGFQEDDIDVVLNKVMPEEPADEQEAEKTIARGEPEKAKKPGYDPEDGVPLPTDLNAKLSDYAQYGIDVEKADNVEEPGEIIDDPKRYMDSSGELDRKKISKKLDTMKMGDKLTLGRHTFSRTVGDNGTKFHNDPVKGRVAQESIMEAEESDVLTPDEVEAFTDQIAARVNDHYFLNGPRNDQAAAMGDVAQNSKLSGAAASTKTGATPNQPGKSPSGQYDAKEMYNILKTDFQKGEAWVNSLTRKVMQADSVSKMSDSDMHDLALLGWALVRARN